MANGAEREEIVQKRLFFFLIPGDGSDILAHL